MRRGQAEILGLVVVVLILVFALIFFVKFKGSDTDDESKLIRFNLRANSALNALMKVHTITPEGARMQMKDFVEDCVSVFDPATDSPASLPNGCNEVKDDLGFQLDIIFSDSKDYQLVVSKDHDDIFSLGNGCKSSISASPFILRYGGKVEFKICT